MVSAFANQLLALPGDADAGVAHFKPVVSALSATKSAILREQSQRIVLGA